MDENGSAKRLKLEQALSEYLRRTDQGEDVDKRAFLESYSDLKEELSRYFNDAEALKRLLQELRNGPEGDGP